VKAAGIAFVTNDGRMLFLLRAPDSDEHPDVWCLPGGHLDRGERAIDAAMREAREETGWIRPEESTAPPPKHVVDSDGFATFRQEVGSEFIPTLDEDHVAWAWAPLDSPPQPLHPNLRRTLGAIAGDSNWSIVDAEKSTREGEADGHLRSSLRNAGKAAGGNLEKAKSMHANVDPTAHDQPMLSTAANSGMPLADLRKKARDALDGAIDMEPDDWRGLVGGLLEFFAEEAREPEHAGDEQDNGPNKEQFELTGGERMDDVGDEKLPGDLVATDSSIRLAMDKDSVRTRDKDGRLHVGMTNLCKACVSPYRGEEIPGWEELGLDPSQVYQLLRDPDELQKGMQTINGVPLLRKHVPVSADDHRPHDVVGAVGTSAEWTAPFIRNGITIWPAADIDGVETGEKEELSPGYHYKPDMTPGSYQGEHYDGVMREIVFNHVALVEDGRQGPEVVVGDSNEKLWANVEQELIKMGLAAA